MPALFAYLLAIALLLGGGYGALNWLAAPEPVKLTAKLKSPRSPPTSYLASSEATNSERVAPAADRPDATIVAPTPHKASEAANDPSIHSEIAEPPVAKTATDKTATDETATDKAATDKAAPDQKDLAEAAVVAPVESMPPVDSKAEPEQLKPAQTAPVSSSERSPTEASTAATNTPVKTLARQHARTSVGRSRKPALVLMTLQTIEFPDGRRVNRLVPYDGGRRQAFEGDE